jgi:hypothetical protein
MTGHGADHGSRRVEKIMSLTLLEFQTTLAPLIGRAVGANELCVTHPLGPGCILIAYDAQPGVRFGGLLELPRAVVSLTFEGVDMADQMSFLKRFEFNFQRGGG